MEGQKPDTTPEPGGPGILHRREHLRRQLTCPKCGSGRMPETKYCLSCGAKLPEIQHEESPEIIALNRPRARRINWSANLVPGAFSFKVLWRSVLMCAAGIAGGLLAMSMMAMFGALGPLGSVLIFCLYLAAGFLSVVVWLSGLSWLLCGRACNTVDAFADFRLEHWVLLVTLTSLAVLLVAWIA